MIMTFFDDEHTKLTIICIYKGDESCQNHEENDLFSQIKTKYWIKWFKHTNRMRVFALKNSERSFKRKNARSSLVPEGIKILGDGVINQNLQPNHEIPLWFQKYWNLYFQIFQKNKKS